MEHDIGIAFPRDANMDDDGIWTLTEDTPEGSFWELFHLRMVTENGEIDLEYVADLPPTEPFIAETITAARHILEAEIPANTGQIGDLIMHRAMAELLVMRFGLWKPANAPVTQWRVISQIPSSMGYEAHAALHHASARIMNETAMTVISGVADYIRHRQATCLKEED